MQARETMRSEFTKIYRTDSIICGIARIICKTSTVCKMAANPPNLSERQKCHKARDEYFNCLDTVKDKSNCEELKKALESVCRPTWVIIYVIIIHSTHTAIQILIVLTNPYINY